jgi:hypothetical protein
MAAPRRSGGARSVAVAARAVYSIDPIAPCATRSTTTIHTSVLSTISTVVTAMPNNGGTMNGRRPMRSITRPAHGRATIALTKKIVVASPTSKSPAPSSSRTKRDTPTNSMPIGMK